MNNRKPSKKMNVLRIFLIGLPAALVLLAIIIALQPRTFRVSRTTTISSPPTMLFAHVNDLHNWPEWSPWAKLDPAMRQSYEGAASGTGAIYHWAGNKEVGEGRMTIMESHPNELIRIKLEFLKPFKATNTAEFTFTPDRNNTVVTWSMFGEKNFMFKAVHLFLNMDKMVGRDFAKGLASLKAIAEREAKTEQATLRP